MRENPFGLDHPIADQIHLEATAKAIAHLDAGRPVDVLDIISASLPETCRGPSAAQHGKPYRLRIQSGFITVYPELRQHQYQPGRSLAGEHEALFESDGQADHRMTLPSLPTNQASSTKQTRRYSRKH